MALATTYAKGSRTGAAQQAYEEDVYKPKQEYTVSGRPVTQAAQDALGPATGGQTYSSYNYGNNVTTSKINSDGTIAGVDTRPFEKTITYGANGEVITKESPLSTTIQKPVTKVTEATTKDGRVYIFEGDNWLEYAAANGLDPNSLATALSYPNYVDSKEVNRYLGDQAAMYGVNLSNPNPNSGVVYSQNQGASVIPNYSAAGGTASAESVLGYAPGAYKSFDAEGWFNDAKDSNRESVESQRSASNAAFDYNLANTNDTYDKNAQNAYILSTISNKKAADQMRESGIKSGMTESSLLRGQLNFENAYNENEANRAAAIREIEMQRAQANAEFDAQIAAYEADAALTYMQIAQQENAAANEYAYKNYWAQQEQNNIDREFAYMQEQDELDRQAKAAGTGSEPEDNPVKSYNKEKYNKIMANVMDKNEWNTRRSSYQLTGQGSKEVANFANYEEYYNAYSKYAMEEAEVKK